MPSAIYKSVWWDGTPQPIIELSLKQGNVWHWQWGRCATSTPLTKAGYSSSLQSHNVESENGWNLKTTDVLFPLVDIGILVGWLIEGFEQTPLTTGMMIDDIPNRPKPIFSKRTLVKTTSWSLTLVMPSRIKSPQTPSRMGCLIQGPSSLMVYHA